ncbi:hypothetical protein FFWV33_07975 [Flavobacterium faecale]|uniref:Glycosyltransferase family 1 protein n=1 Tax=Flavobacterium faecale TaxID=1355330 RepID=A0A2S1LCP6_9FLAO|nr:hypothetical protein [Flavobacterium faecale]AWG21477.1 hypothetical protein FFWV33_07975 [Flavobacterium faecale]
MQLFLSTWTHHLNQLIYSYLYFCKSESLDVTIIQDTSIVHNGGLLLVEDKKIFFDYSDDPQFIDKIEKFDLYFKRSLREECFKGNVYPLNFNVPLSYKPHLLFLNLKKDLLFDRRSRIEVLKALDLFGLVFKSSHKTLNVNRYPEKVVDHGGRVLFHTRLWNPDNHPDLEEKERRRLQNDFRINACRIIKKNFENASVGLTMDNLSIEIAPDLILTKRESNKNYYLNTVMHHDIGIADDGLKDCPGWKIGEYLFYGKAVITTPLNIIVDNFKPKINYEMLSSRSAFEELPDKIDSLLKDKRYLQMGSRNKEWSTNYIHPQNYLKRILTLLKEK